LRRLIGLLRVGHLLPNCPAAQAAGRFFKKAGRAIGKREAPK
jgi:hypothetical protein